MDGHIALFRRRFAEAGDKSAPPVVIMAQKQRRGERYQAPVKAGGKLR
jgi:hypothetical protein